MLHNVQIFNIVAESPLPVPCKKFIYEEMCSASDPVATAMSALDILIGCQGFLRISPVTGESMKVPVLANWQFGWLADAVKLTVLFSLPAAEGSIYSSITTIQTPHPWSVDFLTGILEVASIGQSRSEKNYEDVLAALLGILSKKTTEDSVPRGLECRFGLAVQNFVDWLSRWSPHRRTEIWHMLKNILRVNDGHFPSPLCALFAKQCAHKCVSKAPVTELCDIFLGNVPPTVAVPS